MKSLTVVMAADAEYGRAVREIATEPDQLWSAPGVGVVVAV